MRKTKKPTRYLYKTQNDVNTEGHRYFHEMLSMKMEITNEELHQAFMNITKISTVTKLQDFQYRLLANDIHLNNRLYHWKIVNTQECEYCKKGKQTVTHFFFDCENAQMLWQKMRKYLSEYIQVDPSTIEINLKNIILNKVHPKPNHLCNLIILIAKRTMFVQKCLGKEYSLNEVVQNVEQMYQIEKFNSSKNNTIERFNEKWAPYMGNQETEQ